MGGIALAVFMLARVRRLRRGVRSPWRFTHQAGLGSFLLLVVCGLIAAMLASTLIPQEAVEARTPRAVLLLMLAGWGGQAMALALLLGKGAIRPARADGGGFRRRTPAAAVVIGLLGLAIFWPLTNMANVLGALTQEAVTGVAPSGLAHGLLPMLIEAGPSPWTWGIVAAVIVGPAVFEEILYRGLLQESLRRSGLGRTRGAWAAISLSSGVFVLMHVGAVDVHALPALFVLSMGFGWAFARTGTLTACVTMHLLFNAGNLLFAVPWIIG